MTRNKELLEANNIQGKPVEIVAFLLTPSKPEIVLFRFRNQCGKTAFRCRRQVSENSLDSSYTLTSNYCI